MESSSIDIVILISSSPEFPGDQVFEAISRVLRPGGTIFICKYLKRDIGNADKVNLLWLVSSLN